MKENVNNPNNKLNDAEAEALAWIAEEAAEVIKAVTKILRFGLYSSSPKQDVELDNENRDDLNREIGDMQAALCLGAELGIIDEEDVNVACSEKIRTVGKYLFHQNISSETWSEYVIGYK